MNFNNLKQLPPGSLIFNNRDISGLVADAIIEERRKRNSTIMSSKTYIMLNPSADTDPTLQKLEASTTVHHIEMKLPGREFKSRGIIIDKTMNIITLENVWLEK